MIALPQVQSVHWAVETADHYIDLDTGIRMDALPHIQDDGRSVWLKVHARITDILADPTITRSGTVDSTPRIQVTQIPFQTTVESGKTVVIVGPEMNAKNDKTNRFEKLRLYVLLKPTALTAPEDK